MVKSLQPFVNQTHYRTIRYKNGKKLSGIYQHITNYILTSDSLPDFTCNGRSKYFNASFFNGKFSNSTAPTKKEK